MAFFNRLKKKKQKTERGEKKEREWDPAKGVKGRTWELRARAGGGGEKPPLEQRGGKGQKM